MQAALAGSHVFMRHCKALAYLSCFTGAPAKSLTCASCRSGRGIRGNKGILCSPMLLVPLPQGLPPAPGAPQPATLDQRLLSSALILLALDPPSPEHPGESSAPVLSCPVRCSPRSDHTPLLTGCWGALGRVREISLWHPGCFLFPLHLPSHPLPMPGNVAISSVSSTAILAITAHPMDVTPCWFEGFSSSSSSISCFCLLARGMNRLAVAVARVRVMVA